MDTDISTFLAGKPVCFALPLKFHLVDPRCESCRVVNECGCAVRAMVDAISQGQVGNKAIREARLSKYRSHLTYWDDADKHPVRHYPVPLLEALMQRAEDYRGDAVLQTVRSPNMVSSDQEYDRAVEDLLDHVSSIVSEPEERVTHDEGREQAGTAEDRSDARFGMGNEIAGTSISGNRTDGTRTSPVCTLPPALVSPTGASVPLLPDSLSSVSHEELQQELRLLIQHYYAAGPTSYAGLRARFLEINFALNLARRWGPRFRDIPVSFTPAGAEFNQLDVDRQVIDLHWLWSTNRRKPCTLRQYERLLCSDPFDLACAERFAGENWRWETKAEYLHLSPDVQWELCAIQSKAISKRWDTIKDGDRVGAHVRQTGARQVEAVLQALTAPQHERHIPDRVATWMAVTICKKQWAKAAKLCALITGGKPRDPRQIQRTFETVDKAIKNAKSGKP